MKAFTIYSIFLFTGFFAHAQSGFNKENAEAIVNLSEYEIRWQDQVKAFQSPNRNHNLR